MLKADTGRLREPAALITLAVVSTGVLIGIARLLISSDTSPSSFGVRSAVYLQTLVSPLHTALAVGAVLLVTKLGEATRRARLVALGSAAALGLGVLFGLVAVVGVLFGDLPAFRDRFEYLITGLPMIALAAVGAVFAIRSAAALPSRRGPGLSEGYGQPGQFGQGGFGGPGNETFPGQEHAPGLPQGGPPQGGHGEGFANGPGFGPGAPAHPGYPGQPVPPPHPGQYGQGGQPAQQGQYGQPGEYGQQYGEPADPQEHGQQAPQGNGQQSPPGQGQHQVQQSSGPSHEGQHAGQAGDPPAAPGASHPQLPPPPAQSQQQAQPEPGGASYPAPYGAQDRPQGAFGADRSQDPYAPADSYGQPAQAMPPAAQQQPWPAAESAQRQAYDPQPHQSQPHQSQAHQPSGQDFQPGAAHYAEQFGASPQPLPAPPLPTSATPYGQAEPAPAWPAANFNQQQPAAAPADHQTGQHPQGPPPSGHAAPPPGPAFDQYGYAGQRSEPEGYSSYGAQQGGSPFSGYSGAQFARQAAEQAPDGTGFDSGGFEAAFDGPPYDGGGADPREQQLAQAYQQAQSYQQQARPVDYSSGPTGPMNPPQEYQGYYDNPLGHPQTPERPVHPVGDVEQTMRFNPAAYQGDSLSDPPSGGREEPLDPTAIYAPERPQAKYEEGSGSDQSGRGTDPNLPWYGSDR